MNPYYNLPPEQQFTQRLVDQFNTDERLWRKLEPRRRLRRKLLPGLSKKKLKELDLAEFVKAKASHIAKLPNNLTFEEAAPLLLESCRTPSNESLQGMVQGQCRQAIKRTIALYDAWGKPDEAAHWRKAGKESGVDLRMGTNGANGANGDSSRN